MTASRLVSATALLAALSSAAAQIDLLNVSYDPTRELYRAYNAAFARHYKDLTGDDVTVRQSHGGSGKQARSVIDGVLADVVSLSVALDIDEIQHKGKLIKRGWQQRLPFNAAPYASTIVFLVRKGNPKNIRTWDDLVKPGVEVITPNPKTGGGSRWNYLAAWGATLERELGGDLSKVRASQAGRDAPYRDEVARAEAAATDFVTKLYRNVKVLDSGARGSTTTFMARKIGDVLLAWENEAILALTEIGATDIDLVVPPSSILCEPVVAVVDVNVDKKGPAQRRAAEEFVKYLFSPEAQKIIAHYGYRAARPEFADPQDLKNFPELRLFRLDQLYKDWRTAQKVHFADGALFDRIYQGHK